MNSPKPPRCRLYLVTPPALEPAAFAETLKAALDAGDVGALQLRLKDAGDDAIERAIDALLPVAKARGVTFILNDRPDLARAAGCDGVHVGQEDATVREARQTIGDNGVVGATCHNSRHLALVAGEQGADYVAFGAFFPTATKEAKTQADPDILEWWSDIMVLPCVAIGGITVENCPPLVRAGADFLAVVSAIWNHPEGAPAAVKAFNAAIAEASAS